MPESFSQDPADYSPIASDDDYFFCHKCGEEFPEDEYRYVDSEKHCRDCGLEAAKAAYAAHIRVEMFQAFEAVQYRMYDIAADYDLDDVCGRKDVDTAIDKMEAFMSELRVILP